MITIISIVLTISIILNAMAFVLLINIIRNLEDRVDIVVSLIRDSITKITKHISIDA